MKKLLALTSIVAALVLAVGAWAAKPEEAEGARLKAEAEGLTKQAEQMQNVADKAVGELKTDAQSLVNAIQAKAAVAQKRAEAKIFGDDTALKTTADDYAKASAAMALAQDRYTIRSAEMNLQPTQEQQDRWQKNPVEDLKALREATIIARVKAVAAANTLLATMKPNAPVLNVETARDAWIASQDELELANRTLGCTENRTRLAQRVKDHPELQTKLEALAKADAEYLAAFKASREQALMLRILDRRRTLAAKDVESIANKPKGK